MQRIARDFRRSNYDIKVALRSLLRSPTFWARENRGALVKSPIDVVVGTLRQLELSPSDARPFALVATGMGQNLFAPPNVRGWPGGEVWINSNTLLARKQYLDRIARNDADVPPGMVKAAATATGTMEIRDTPSPPLANDEAIAQNSTNSAAQDSPSAATQASRIARGIERGLRSVRFDAAGWLARRDGATREARLESARMLLLPIPPQLPATPDADATTAVHALLLDPAYELK